LWNRGAQFSSVESGKRNTADTLALKAILVYHRISLTRITLLRLISFSFVHEE
jgi:hypothetical protein